VAQTTLSKVGREGGVGAVASADPVVVVQAGSTSCRWSFGFLL
jgi:hypothetical protein